MSFVICISECFFTRNIQTTGHLQDQSNKNNNDHFGDFFDPTIAEFSSSTNRWQKVMFKSHMARNIFSPTNGSNRSMNIKQQKQVPRHCSGWIHPSPSPETMGACRARPISWKWQIRGTPFPEISRDPDKNCVLKSCPTLARPFVKNHIDQQSAMAFRIFLLRITEYNRIIHDWRKKVVSDSLKSAAVNTRSRGVCVDGDVTVRLNSLFLVPSGKHTKNYGKSPFLMGKLTINGHVQ